MMAEKPMNELEKLKEQVKKDLAMNPETQRRLKEGLKAVVPKPR